MSSSIAASSADVGIALENLSLEFLKGRIGIGTGEAFDVFPGFPFVMGVASSPIDHLFVGNAAAAA